MPLYEHVLMGRQDISPQQFEGLVESYQAIIKENGGSVEKTELWGLKNLAYKIKKNRKAHFALMNLDSPHEAVAEMERQMGLSTDVIRFLTLRVDKLEDGPSAMMKRGDRDDRRGGRRDRDRDRDSRSERPAKASETTAAKGSSDKGEKSDAADKGEKKSDAAEKPKETAETAGKEE